MVSDRAVGHLQFQNHFTGNPTKRELTPKSLLPQNSSPQPEMLV